MKRLIMNAMALLLCSAAFGNGVEVFEPIALELSWQEAYRAILGTTHEEKSQNARTTLEMKAVAEFSRWRVENDLAEAANRLFERLDAEGRDLMLKSHRAWKKHAQLQAVFLTDACRNGSARGLYSAYIHRVEAERRTMLYKELAENATPCTTGLSMYEEPLP